MEINATNEARSTKTENTTHDTRFRLNFALYTPHDCGGSGPDADLSFSGTTPEAFDHALATILDVVTSTVYGGQLNGLQEIIDRSTAEPRWRTSCARSLPRTTPSSPSATPLWTWTLRRSAR